MAELCPCQSLKSYAQCCQRFIEQGEKPATPEALMRSRYTAYTLAHIDYIIRTMQGKPLIGFDATAAKSWAQNAMWLSLRVIHTNQMSDNQGLVEFIATFIEKNHLRTIHELSEFSRIDGQWLYTDGRLQSQKHKSKPIAKNTHCPCGSMKKFKNCHGQYET